MTFSTRSKHGDEAEVLKRYNTNRGRSELQNMLVAQQNKQVQKEIPNFMELLVHWRNSAAHGARTTIGEEDAFFALLLLLRFARFADDRWDDLTRRRKGGGQGLAPCLFVRYPPNRHSNS
jgi:hypothetical protein